jgi:hypothetical protein
VTWNNRLDQRMRRLYLQGEPRWFIADACGVDKTVIATQLKNHRFSDEERHHRRNNYQRRRHQIEHEASKAMYISYENRTEEYRPTQIALAERARRAALKPRDLTAALCGDPLPGYSALERRS